MQKAKNWIVVLFFTITLLLLAGLFFLIGNVSHGIHLSLFVIAYYVFQRQKEKKQWEGKGIKYVFVLGEVAVQDGRVTNIRNGKNLLRNA
jgi:4-hydroxybenzoate polyprenyltransferase